MKFKQKLLYEAMVVQAILMLTFFTPVTSAGISDDSTNVRVSSLNMVIHTYLSDSWNVLIAPGHIQKRHLLPLSAIAAVGGLLYFSDQSITKAFDRSAENSRYKHIIKTGEGMEPMGQIERMNPICIGGIVVGYVMHWPKLQTASLQIIESLAIASGYKTIIRELVGRARPSEKLGKDNFKLFQGESFPSGHTSNAFQVATILSHHVDWLPFTIASYGVATTIGMQRIDANLHWASDVFAGAVYGTAVSKLILRLYDDPHISVLPWYQAAQGQVGVSISRAW